MDYEQWLEKLYIETFEATIRAIEYRKKSDPKYTLNELLSQLEAMYVIDGNNYGGRSIAAQTDLEASIAAMQFMVSQWQKETE